jgi:hypothetical protein
MFQFRRNVFAALAVLLVGGSTAQASFMIDFNVPTSGAAGSFSYAGGAGALSGSNITIATISAPGSGVANLTVTGGNLSFTTGAATGTSGPDTFFSTAGSSILITGSTSVASGTLLSGALTGTAELINAGGGVIEIVETAVFTPTSPAVAAYFGDPTGVAYVGTLDITFRSGSPTGGGVNVAPMPAPNGLVLGGCGAFCLLGYALLRRRRLILGGTIA